VTPWTAVSPLPRVNGDVARLLETIDDQRRVWEETLTLATPAEIEAARKRSLRRHAIETWIIERLYDVDWGVTEALVAEGLTLEVAARDGGIATETLAVIRDHYEALEYLGDAARGDVPFTPFLIRELHALITRHQTDHEGVDQFGRPVRAPMSHGVWKDQPNRAVRPDGSIVEFAPPEQVESAIDQLLAEHERASDAHPIVRAAWFHHQFVLIHPFADGNGRVARVLTLLTLLRHHYAPLVVARHHRAEYLETLDQATSGDLRPLVRLFARLESVALRSELIRPMESVPQTASVVDVARAYTDRLLALRAGGDADKRNRAITLAASVHERIDTHLTKLCTDLATTFRTVDASAASNVAQSAPGEGQAHFWRAQLVATANAVDFFTNLADGSWWTRLRLVVFGQELRYVVAIQRVGRGDTGVLAITAFAEIPPSDRDTKPVPLLHPTADDAVTLVYSDAADQRWPDVAELVDRTLTAAVAGFAGTLG
jgi:hypothetical protein